MGIKYFCDVCDREIVDDTHKWVKIEIHTPPPIGRILGNTKYLRVHADCIANINGTKLLERGI